MQITQQLNKPKIVSLKLSSWILMTFLGLTPLLCLEAVANAFQVQEYKNEPEKALKKVLNSFHQAASEADGEQYFNLLTENAVFLGTDATERWDKHAFKAFALPYFEKGQGWTYIPVIQNITLDSSGKYAFFDELLSSESYGECRGSGVLRLTSSGWKIAQYNLSIPLPNALAKEVVMLIKDQGTEKEKR